MKKFQVLKVDRFLFSLVQNSKNIRNIKILGILLCKTLKIYFPSAFLQTIPHNSSDCVPAMI